MSRPNTPLVTYPYVAEMRDLVPQLLHAMNHHKLLSNDNGNGDWTTKQPLELIIFTTSSHSLAAAILVNKTENCSKGTKVFISGQQNHRAIIDL